MDSIYLISYTEVKTVDSIFTLYHIPRSCTFHETLGFHHGSVVDWTMNQAPEGISISHPLMKALAQQSLGCTFPQPKFATRIRKRDRRKEGLASLLWQQRFFANYMVK